MSKMNTRLLTLSLSIDGATEKTYESIRVGGKWSRLVENLQSIKQFRKTNPSVRLYLNYCVMKRNVGEMVAFVEMAQELGADMVFFQRMYTTPSFADEDLFTDPESVKILKDNLRHPIMQSSWVDVNQFRSVDISE
jgi:MoaA/NifB/PqqE/SkfB family radical SAM enzyme